MLKNWNKYWQNRKIDWSQAYTSTWEHPHRRLIIDKLKKFKWVSLLEIGCASGPNLYRIRREFPNKELGGIDINQNAINEAIKLDRNLALKVNEEKAITLNKEEAGLIINCFPEKKDDIKQFSKPWFLETRDITKQGIFMSDRGLDIILTDMTCIYFNPAKIKKVLEEIKRVARFNAIFVEFHSKSWWQRFRLWWQSGYYAYDWQKLLDKIGFYEIELEKIPEELWPGGNPQKDFGYIITART